MSTTKDTKKNNKQKENESDANHHDDTKDDERSNGGHRDGQQNGKRTTLDILKEKLEKIETTLEKEKSNLKPKPRHEHQPYVFNNLHPYCDTHTQRYIIELPEDVHHGYVNRNTAIGLCDPWVNHQMDVNILPKSESTTSQKSPRSPRNNKENNKKSTGDKDSNKDRPPREGCSHVPNFSNVKEPKDLMNKPIYFDEVPRIREELRKTHSSHADAKINAEYKRTQQDFYRMELDRMEDYHPSSRPQMRKTYFAYLQNNPGSKKALKECIKKVDEREKSKQEEEKKKKDAEAEEEDRENHHDNANNQQNDRSRRASESSQT